jgi:hypothetical protein
MNSGGVVAELGAMEGGVDGQGEEERRRLGRASLGNNSVALEASGHGLARVTGGRGGELSDEEEVAREHRGHGAQMRRRGMLVRRRCRTARDGDTSSVGVTRCIARHR